MKNEIKKSLSEKVSWTNGILDTIDFLAWRTKQLFGISKTELIKKTIKISCGEKVNVSQKYKEVEKVLKQERRSAREIEKYGKIKNGLYIDSDEAMRRLKYFSEGYLNKEFDIFLNLVSDKYLNLLYSKIFKIKNGKWSSHGNGRSFKDFTFEINPKFANEMQMDNLAYNEKSLVLVANELKLGAKANKDQILKYVYLFEKLKENELIDKKTEFKILFITIKNENYSVEKIKDEIEFLKKQKNKEKFLAKNILESAKKIEIGNLTWKELIEFNERFLEKLDKKTQQTEIKLIEGFNMSLKEKYLIQKSL